MNQQLLKEIERTISVYDPLVVYVNKNFILEHRYNSIGIKGRNFGDYIKVLYERNGVPNMYSKHYEYCCISPITKHSTIETTR